MRWPADAGGLAFLQNFAFSEEQEELRRITRQFLESKSPETEVRRLMDTTEGYDPAVWSQMANELGLQSLMIPEEYGGGHHLRRAHRRPRGDGPGAAGRPLLLDVVLAGNAILHSGDEAAKEGAAPRRRLG